VEKRESARGTRARERERTKSESENDRSLIVLCFFAVGGRSSALKGELKKKEKIVAAPPESRGLIPPRSHGQLSPFDPQQDAERSSRAPGPGRSGRTERRKEEVEEERREEEEEREREPRAWLALLSSLFFFFFFSLSDQRRRRPSPASRWPILSCG
jgi:hypothetical protein